MSDSSATSYIVPISTVLDENHLQGGGCPSFQTSFRCPLCARNYQHMGEPHDLSEDVRSAAFALAGGATILPFEGECGHEWDIVIGYHKGNHYIFARTYEPTST